MTGYPDCAFQLRQFPFESDFCICRRSNNFAHISEVMSLDDLFDDGSVALIPLGCFIHQSVDITVVMVDVMVGCGSAWQRDDDQDHENRRHC